MTTETVSSPVQTGATGRGYFWAAIAVFVLSLVAAAIQFGVIKELFVPWYAPAFTTIAAVMLICSLAQRRTIARIIVFVLLTAVAGFEWVALVALSKLPDYEGPARVGAKMPAFQTVLADGRTFSDKDLQDGTPSVLIFFRGRW